MAIIEPVDMSFEDKKFSMIIYAPPGLGKTTLALSAPNPVLIDTDKGISRVKTQHRKATSMCRNYEEISADLKEIEKSDFETIIIDTGGSFITYLQDWVIRNNTFARQKSGALSQKGFGMVKQEFLRFTNHIRDVMNKNIIYVFHSDEQKDDSGNFVQRLQCEGSARNLVWQPCDFGGFMQMNGNTRTITFTPSERFFAKGCYGIEGTMNIPTLTSKDKNEFITNLFKRARENIKAENMEFAPLKEKYDKAIFEAKAIIDAIKTPEEATKAVETLQAIDYRLTSHQEAIELFQKKISNLGFIYDKQTKTYNLPPENQEDKS